MGVRSPRSPTFLDIPPTSFAVRVKSKIAKCVCVSLATFDPVMLLQVRSDRGEVAKVTNI
jgi:hypothetical protein